MVLTDLVGARVGTSFTIFSISAGSLCNEDSIFVVYPAMTSSLTVIISWTSDGHETTQPTNA